MTSQPAKSVFESLNIDMLDAQGNMRNVIDLYREVAKASEDLTRQEQIAVAEGLAGKFQIARMQQFLSSLREANGMYDQMIQAQGEATNSAIEENEEYMKSFEARLAGTRRSIEELALAMGDAFLSESMVQGLKLFTSALQDMTKATETIGVLPVVLSLAGAAFLTFSKSARTWAQALIFGTKEMEKHKRELISLEENLTRGSTATKLFERSWKTMISGLGVTVGLVAVGLAFEYILSKITETRQRAEELQNQLDGQRREYSANADEINRLTDEYAELEKRLKNSSLSEEERTQTTERMLAVQKELSNIMPSMVIAEDEYGNVTYETAQSIKARNEMMEQQIAIEKERQRLEEQASRFDLFKQQEKDAKAFGKTAEHNLTLAQNWLTITERNLNLGKGFFDIDINSVEEARDAVNRLNEERQKLLAEGDEKGANKAQIGIDKITESANLAGLALKNVESASFGMLETLSHNFNEVVHSTNAIGDSTKAFLSGFTMMIHEAGASTEDAKKLFNSLSYTVANDKTFQSYAKNYEGLLNDLERAKKAYDVTPNLANEETLRKSVEAVQNAYQGMINHLMDILRNSGIEDMSVLDGLEKQFEQELIGMLAQTKTLEEIAETTGQSVEEVALALQMLGDEAGDTGDAVGDLGDDVNHLESALKKITGTTLDNIDATWELVEEYEKLYNLLQFLEEGTEEFDIAQQHLLAIEKKLLDIFPQLRVQKEKYGATTQDLIALSKREVQETDIVQSAYHDLSNGMLDANQQRVLSSYNASKAIINNLKQEQAAYKMSLDNAGKQLMRLSQIKNPTEEQKAMINSLDSTVRARSKGLESYGKAIEYNENALQKSINTMKTFPTYSDRNTERTEKNTKANKSNTKAKKDNKKATKEKAKEEELASFIADKYRRAIEELNYALKQQQAIKSQFPKHSKEYQNALRAELKLEQERLKLMQNQTKELQNAVRVGKAPQTGVVSAKQQPKAQTVTTNRKLSGWQAPVNSQFGMRWGRMHEGVDIAQAKGTRLDANVAGIVKRAMSHKTYGNVVYVVDNTGKEHRYAHLNSINVKQGQKVNVGDQLGAIGSTGRSSGPHLHYEVRVNGKAVNPMDFVKAAKGNKAITTQVKEVSNVSKEVAQAQASVYDVQGQILDLQGSIIDQQIKIAELQAEMIRAELAQFDKRRETYGYHLDYEATKYEQVAKTSQRYLNVLARQEAFMIKKQNTNKEELTQLDKLIKSGNLQGSVLEEVTKRYQDLRIEISNTNTELSKLKEQQIDAQLYKWILNAETFDFELAKLEQNLRLATEGTEHWLNLMNQKSSYLESQRSAIKQEINQLTELLKMSNLLTPDAIEKYQRRLRELTLQYREMGITLLDINDQQEKLAKGEINAWNEIADKMISAYKKAMEQKRDIQQKALDKEMEAEDKRHKKAIENLNKELDKYREIINEKLKEIDREDEDRSFNREIQELQNERQQIQAEINLLKADNTRDAKYRRKKLQEDLLKIDQKIADKNYQREKEQRKDNLNEMLSDKEKEIKDREELENNYHESEKDRIDKLKEYWNQYYTDRINDERKFSQWRKDLANGEYEHILKLFDDLAIELEDSLQDITNTLDGTMEGVGTSIRVNIIDELREAIRVAKEFSNVISSGKDGSGIDLSAGLGGSTGTKPAKAQYEHRDYQVIAGKLIRHNLSQYAQTEAKELELKKHGSDLANGGRARGSKLDKLVQYDELIKNMNTSDIEGFTAYLERYIRQLGNADYELKDWLAREIQRLRLSASFDSGGFTGSWGKSGKLATLHQNELILNEKETNKFGNLISKFDGLSRMLDSLVLGNSTAQSNNYVMEVNIENFTGTEENARSLGEILNDEWTNKFRVERGMRG